jgi:hypothetical protein
MKPVTVSELIDTMNRLMAERDEARRELEKTKRLVENIRLINATNHSKMLEARRIARRLFNGELWGRIDRLHHECLELHRENAALRAELASIQQYISDQDGKHFYPGRTLLDQIVAMKHEEEVEYDEHEQELDALLAEIENMRRPVGMCPAGTKPPE